MEEMEEVEYLVKIVKIKTWEEMIKEFGLLCLSDEDYFPDSDVINCQEHYTDYMEKELPEDRIIEIVYDRDLESQFIGTWYVDGDQTNSWNISDDMIKVEISSTLKKFKIEIEEK